MKIRLLFLMLLIPVLICCETADPEPDHRSQYDRYDGYWIHYDTRYDMPCCPDDYFIVFHGRSAEKVMKAVEKEGFSCSTEPGFSSLAYRFDEEYPLYEDFSYMGYMDISGKGDVSKIPDVIFSNNLYQFDGRKIGHTFLFTVTYDKKNEKDEIARIVGYARERNLVPIGKGSVYAPLFLLACTDRSDGNPLEMCNWFMEETEFTYAEPMFVDEAFPLGPLPW